MTEAQCSVKHTVTNNFQVESDTQNSRKILWYAMNSRKTRCSERLLQTECVCTPSHNSCVEALVSSVARRDGYLPGRD